jgi:hypothetical protein
MRPVAMGRSLTRIFGSLVAFMAVWEHYAYGSKAVLLRGSE